MMNKPVVGCRSSFWLSGLAATFTGNGIGRFAYITLMPALIQANWFSKEEAAQLGVATLLGYLLGPWLIQRTTHHLSRATLMRLGMVLCSMSYLACAFPQMSFSWFYSWRLLAGLGGSILMVLAAPLILPHVPQSSRGRTAGLIFSGIGLGAALSGLLIPLLVGLHVTVAWLAMGLSCAALTLITWNQWSQISSLKPAISSQPIQAIESGSSRPLWQNQQMWCLLSAYGLNAIGFLPHTLFWVDFLVREIGTSLAMGGLSWALFGIGAAVGPLVTGYCCDRWGVRFCLLVGFGLKALGVALPLLSLHLGVLHVSAFLVGMFTPGIVTLVSMYALQLVGVQEHSRAWGAMTFSFALTQAGGGLAMALLIQQMNSYLPLYAISALALVLAIFCILCIDQTAPQTVPKSL
jgi:predicted MFS family arabinose efflux permease